ncbi:hypothetical protein OHS70_24625 [Streptomyces sp. NBC_00390]|uniref:hypothetical protein n=1 Tax=Streptomyces sp. NBC_00390 TaxID=2975736 RepID=UPI002E1BF2A4
MTQSNTPLSPLPLSHLSEVQQRVMSTSQLRALGVTPARIAEQCRAGGTWQLMLPGVYLLRPGTPTSQERLHGALLYAGRRDADEAMITGMASLALYGFSTATPLMSLEFIDVLVARTRRLRSAGCVRLVRAHALPASLQITGLPVAPVARAVADAVAQLTDAKAVRAMLTEAVRGGHCEPAILVRELNDTRLLDLPHVVGAVDSLLAEGRALSEGRLYEVVRGNRLPEPLWNVDLRLPGGPHLGGVDAYWPEQAVAVELDTRAPRQDDDARWSASVRKREHLERLGITVVHITPRKLRESPDQQAVVVRTALMAAVDREPAAYVVVLPR